MKYFSALTVIVLVLILTQIESFNDSVENVYSDTSEVTAINETRYLSVPSVDINENIEIETKTGVRQYNNNVHHPLEGNLVLGAHDWEASGVTDDTRLEGLQALKVGSNEKVFLSWGDGLYVYVVDSIHVVTHEEAEILSKDRYQTPHITMYSWLPEYEINERLVITGELLEYEVKM